MQEIQKILDSYTEEIKRIYGQHLQKNFLYGSYARGEETSSSDIDIMLMPIVKKAEHYRAANNRAYYSVYHSITAVFCCKQ